VNIGIESINPETIKEDEQEVQQGRPSLHKRIAGGTWRKRGISYSLNFIFGLGQRKRQRCFRSQRSIFLTQEKGAGWRTSNILNRPE